MTETRTTGTWVIAWTRYTSGGPELSTKYWSDDGSDLTTWRDLGPRHRHGPYLREPKAGRDRLSRRRQQADPPPAVVV